MTEIRTVDLADTPKYTIEVDLPAEYTDRWLDKALFLIDPLLEDLDLIITQQLEDMVGLLESRGIPARYTKEV